MKKITLFTLIAVFSMAFVGCETTKETNSNKAIVVNSNAASNMANSNMMNSNMMSSNTMTSNSNSMSMNSNMTRADYDRDRSRYEQEAKASGRTVGSGINDSWLWTKTKTALATTAGLRDSTINVDVTNDVVTLSGTVGTKEQQTMAIKTANEIEGVKSVKNNLTVSVGDSLTNQMTGSNSGTSGNTTTTTTKTNTNKR
jgi:osmotically-inducible protein OsmY